MELRTRILDKNCQNPVLNIEFSGGGDYLAISYDNARSSKGDEKVEKSKAIIAIYNSRSG